MTLILYNVHQEIQIKNGTLLKKKKACHFKDIYLKKEKEDKDNTYDIPKMKNMKENKSIVVWI